MDEFLASTDKVLPPDPKLELVRQHFEHPWMYLNNNVNVELRMRIVRRHVGDVHNAHILDLGCGSAAISLQFLDTSNRITLVDMSASMLSIARSNTPAALAQNVEYVHGDLHAFGNTTTYDLVICLGVLAHVKSLSDTISHIASVLKQGGRCVLQITDAEALTGKLNLWCWSVLNSISRNGLKLNRTTASQIVQLASEHGLRCLDHCRYSLILPGMGKLSSRLRLAFELFVVRTPAFAKHGSELILFFTKGL